MIDLGREAGYWWACRGSKTLIMVVFFTAEPHCAGFMSQSPSRHSINPLTSKYLDLFSLPWPLLGSALQSSQGAQQHTSCYKAECSDSSTLSIISSWYHGLKHFKECSAWSKSSYVCDVSWIYIFCNATSSSSQHHSLWNWRTTKQ